MTTRIKLFGYEWAFSRRRIRTEPVKGITNLCEDGRLCIFLDFDNISIQRLKKEIEFIQNKFDLGTFFIFSSSENSYHAVCLDKVSFHQHLKIMRETSVDENYINVPNKYGLKLWTLRLSPKNGVIPHWVGNIPRETRREQSYAHKKAFQTYYKIPIDIEIPDTLRKVKFASYKI